ncbi:MAG: helix-turn-helix domain-containing protein [Rhodobiaceae bacterium]|nr:helix-turn-helix domain-containing protein [Rhodobiaceae bacterium]
MPTAILAHAESRPGGTSTGKGASLQQINISHESTDSTPVTVREHELVFAEGDAAHQRYDIVDGAVMLFRVLPDGRRQLVELLGPGDMFGLTCASEYDCSAETLVATRLRVSHRLDCSQVPAAICRMCGQLQKKVAELHEHSVVLGRKSAMEKVVSFLLRLASMDTGRRANGHVRLAMTRQEMADYLGLTIETVSRSLSELRRRGLIVFEKADWFHIPDAEAMESLSGDR